jgi:hypothetical protein
MRSRRGGAAAGHPRTTASRVGGGGGLRRTVELHQHVGPEQGRGSALLVDGRAAVACEQASVVAGGQAAAPGDWTGSSTGHVGLGACVGVW